MAAGSSHKCGLQPSQLPDAAGDCLQEGGVPVASGGGRVEAGGVQQHQQPGTLEGEGLAVGDHVAPCARQSLCGAYPRMLPSSCLEQGALVRAAMLCVALSARQCC